MQKILEYLYTGETRVNSNEIEEFLRTANKLKIVGLYHGIESEDETESEANIPVCPPASVVQELESSDKESESESENENDQPIAAEKGSNRKNRDQNQNQTSKRSMNATSTQDIVPPKRPRLENPTDKPITKTVHHSLAPSNSNQPSNQPNRNGKKTNTSKAQAKHPSKQNKIVNENGRKNERWRINFVNIFFIKF